MTRSRFAVLRHEMPPGSDRPSHWDVMLEHGEVLVTWACTSLPAPDVPAEAEQLPDHRLAYLQYEGPVSGDRGAVSRWDEGEYQITYKSTTRWIVQLSGRNLSGCLTVELVDPDRQLWNLSFSPGRGPGL